MLLSALMKNQYKKRTYFYKNRMAITKSMEES